MRFMLLQVGALALAGGLTLPAFADTSAVKAEAGIFEEVFAEGVQLDGHGGKGHSDPIKRVKAICSKVKATEEQKKAIRDEVLAYKEKAIPLEATEKVAKLKYYRNVVNTDGTLEIADSTASQCVMAKTDLLKAKEALSNKILFGILEQEQREPGFKCMLAIERLKEHHRRD